MSFFGLAAPVFWAHGYRSSTIKALAHARHLISAALYRYFPSKAGFATFLNRRGPARLGLDPHRP